MSLENISANPQVDAELQTRIGVALALKQRSSFVGLKFEVRNRIATIWGEVPTFFDRQVAAEAVRRVVGLRQVKDEITVTAQKSIRTAGVLLLAAVTAIVGCNKAAPALHPAQGQITVNGRPLAGALVVLHPVAADRAPARAQTKADGTFELTTFSADDGAAAGEFFVTVSYFPPVLAEGEVQAGPNVIPPQYSDPANTQLKVNIHEGTNELPPIALQL